MKKKIAARENYLERKPVRNGKIAWKTDENSLVTLEIKNEGIINKVVQKLFRKPKISYIHLDANGSFIWPLIDGETSIIDIGRAVDEHFGKDAYPLYERLAKFFQILEGYEFVSFKRDVKSKQ